ncbi:coiled-coil domain-containing protein 112-like [Maniola hyperantus]|uniref:coiled-coil domain-containing protein 112-like n=1 Tax=Aphantopus hyperantus TaxID=2795564 RepID=UPI0015688F59|nr:coiled-coil domain-containing protein 112-like [Maniola hyperantus]
MNSSSNNSLTSDIARDNCLSSKLRRLKIQENVLSANVNKCFLLNAEEIDEKIKYDSDIKLKKYFSVLKDKYREIKHLFEDITLKTNDQYMEKSDIDELKRDILELETKIRIVKQFLTSELQNLRNEEVALTEKQETSGTLSHEERKIIKRNVSQIKGYKEIVPSPVRVTIHSPFKCSEVQQFQDFMKNSINRYGGWNEYNHNIFVYIWNKYYGDNNMMIAVKSIEETFSYQDFKEEVLHKIPGSSCDSIDSHGKWYSEYLHLKMNQQKALNKWKENKRKIKPTRKALTLQIDESTIDGLKSPKNTKLCRKLNNGNDGNLNNRRNCSSYGTLYI